MRKTIDGKLFELKLLGNYGWLEVDGVAVSDAGFWNMKEPFEAAIKAYKLGMLRKPE